MLLAEAILASNLTALDETLIQLTCLEAILERVDNERHLPLDALSSAIKSKPFFQHRSFAKRDIMEDIVASYSNLFGSKSHPGKKKQPVVFLPNSNSAKNCKPSGQMSSFGYLAFVLSLINGVVNAANNINNNQNNNNNNDNNNNDNNNNVNVANSNLNQNNDNMVTAGRRRRKLVPKSKEREDIRKLLAAHLVDGGGRGRELAGTTHTKLPATSEKGPLVNELKGGRGRREGIKPEVSSELVRQSLLASFVFMDFWNLGEDEDLCSLQKAVDKIGPWAKLIGRLLAQGMMAFSGSLDLRPFLASSACR